MVSIFVLLSSAGRRFFQNDLDRTEVQESPLRPLPGFRVLRDDENHGQVRSMSWRYAVERMVRYFFIPECFLYSNAQIIRFIVSKKLAQRYMSIL